MEKYHTYSSEMKMSIIREFLQGNIGQRDFALQTGRKNSLFVITHDGKKMTCGYYSIVRTAQFNSLVPYEYLVYLFDSLPYREDKRFDYVSYIPWADGIRKRVKEHIANKFTNWKKRVHAYFII